MIDTCIHEVRPTISFLPSTAVLELTYKCNHKCLFCSCPWENGKGHFVKDRELDYSEWKEAIQKISKLGVANICFTGGEAILREDIWDIVKYASSLNDEKIVSEDNKLILRPEPMKLYMISNGQHITDVELELCKKYNIQLSMSLPGIKTFNEHTGGDPNKVLTAFALAKSKGLYTVVNITVTKKNLFELYETIAAAFLAGADQLLMNVFLKGGRGLENIQALALSPDEILFALDEAEKVLQTAGRFGALGTELPKCILKGKKYERLEVGSKCAAAVGFFVVGPSGYIRVCNHSEINLCHYKNIEELKQNEYWQKFTQKKYFPNRCLSCSDMDACDGGCREEAHIISGQIDAMHEFAVV